MFYKIDKELSMDLYTKCKSYINTGECFANVSKIVLRHMQKKKEFKEFKEFKVVFGAWQITGLNVENIYTKHCFFMLGDKIVDPTAYTSNLEESKYLVIKSYSLSEYENLLAESVEYDSWNPVVQRIYDGVFEKLWTDNIVLTG